MKVRFDMTFDIGEIKFEVSALRADGTVVSEGTSTDTVGDALMKAITNASSVGDSEGILAVALMTKFREVLGPSKQAS